MKLRFQKVSFFLIKTPDLVQQENETVSVDGVNGPAIVLGSLSNVSTNGNWPTIFDAKQE